MARDTPAGGVLFVANFPANTGYAWDHIERLFARLADRLTDHDVAAFVAYPAITEPPRPLEGSSAVAVELDGRLAGWRAILAMLRFIRRARIRLVYLTDRPLRSWTYPLLRAAGARAVIVHDRISGARTPPRGLKKAVKWLLARTPGLTPDVVIAVSDYVRYRDTHVALVPRQKIVTVHNGLPVCSHEAKDSGRAYRELGIEEGTPIVACAARASRHKGVDVLLRAFDRLEPEATLDPPPVLVYLGDGPEMPKLREVHAALHSRDRVILGGYRPRAIELLADAAVFVVPSIWQDAFPNAVLEPMSRGKAVVASEVGGIPEMVEHGKSGLLVPPGDEEALAAAIRSLLSDPEERERLGENARRRVAEQFSQERQVDRILRILEKGLEFPAGKAHGPVFESR